jgi:hypothetical protein
MTDARPLDARRMNRFSPEGAPLVHGQPFVTESCPATVPPAEWSLAEAPSTERSLTGASSTQWSLAEAPSTEQSPTGAFSTQWSLSEAPSTEQSLTGASSTQWFLAEAFAAEWSLAGESLFDKFSLALRTSRLARGVTNA